MYGEPRIAQKSHELSFQLSMCSLHLAAYKVLCIQGKKSSPMRRSDSNLGSSASQIGETAKAPPAQMSDLRDKKSRARIQVSFNPKLWNFVHVFIVILCLLWICMLPTGALLPYRESWDCREVAFGRDNTLRQLSDPVGAGQINGHALTPDLANFAEGRQDF